MNRYQLRTRLIHGEPRSHRWDYNHHVVPPMSATASFRLEGARRGATGFVNYGCDRTEPGSGSPIYIYDRLDEPTRGMLEENLAIAEGAETCVGFSSGMAAISAALGVLCQQGDEIVSHRVVYGCTYALMTHWLPRMGVRTRFVDLNDPAQLADALRPSVKVVYCESPINPTLELIDLAAVKRVMEERATSPEWGGGPRPQLVVDNSFATPFAQRPLSLGADVVVHSLTKGIGGFGTEMGGAVLGGHALDQPLRIYRKDFGGVLSSHAAWSILVHGLPTLAARMSEQQRGALEVATWLEQHPRVARVSYPGLESFPQRALARRQMVDSKGRFAPGTMIYFELHDPAADGAAGARLCDWIGENAYSITLAVSLGQVKTLIEHPFSMTHAAMPDGEKTKGGVDPGGVRISVGLEDPADLIADLDAALAKA